MKLLESVRSMQGAGRAAAVAEYREIISRADSPKPGDAQRLADLLGMLGLGIGDAERDANSFAEVAALDSVAAKVDGLEKERAAARAAFDRAAAEVESNRADFERRIAAATDRVTAARAAHEKAVAALNAARESGRAAAALREGIEARFAKLTAAG